MLRARSFHEPEESDRLVDANTALDQIERCVRTVIEAGGEHALRLRLAHLLPPAEVGERRAPGRSAAQRSTGRAA